jgi:uncharacterized protein YdeI (YjbR/CyaY-like superfamily)
VRFGGRGGKALSQEANARGHRSATFFTTPTEFRAWLEVHHVDARELWVGFHKKGTGRPSITWPEAVDQALCFGWIDGVRKSIDDTSYAIRFTPRSARSTWSAVNVKRAEELVATGQMHTAGLAAFAKRLDERTGVYSHEQRQPPAFDEEQEQRFRANPAAWDFFQIQAPSYRKAAIWWVISAKKDETRRKRLATLIADSAAGRTVPPLTRPGKRQ